MAMHRWVRKTIGSAGGSGASSQDESTGDRSTSRSITRSTPITNLPAATAGISDTTTTLPCRHGPTVGGGEINTSPKVGNLQFTSTFSSNALSEFRYSYRNTNLEDKHSRSRIQRRESKKEHCEGGEDRIGVSPRETPFPVGCLQPQDPTLQPDMARSLEKCGCRVNINDDLRFSVAVCGRHEASRRKRDKGRRNPAVPAA